MSKRGLPGFNTRLPRFLEIALALPLGVMIGHQASRGDTDLLLLLAAILLALMIVRRPVIGLYLIAALVPLENMALLRPGFTLIKGIGLVVFGSWLARKLVFREPIVAPSGSLIRPLAAFGLLAASSVFWASYHQPWLVNSLSLLQWIFLVILVVDQMTSWERLENLFFFSVLTGLVSLAIGLYQYFVAGLRASKGAFGSGNTLGVISVTVLPFAFYFLGYGNRLKRLMGLLYILMCILIIPLTFSRATYVIGFALAFFQVGQLRHRKRLMAVVVVLALGLAITPAIPWEQVVSRTQTVWLDVVEEHSARLLHWRGAIAMFLDYPLLGVGYANYGYRFTYEYQFRVSDPYRIWYSPRDAHSTYLRALAELGIVGFGVLVWLLIAAFRNLKGASARAADISPARRHLVISIGWSWIAYFLYNALFSTESDKLFWIVLAATEVVRRLLETETIEPVGVVQRAPVSTAAYTASCGRIENR